MKLAYQFRGNEVVSYTHTEIGEEKIESHDKS